MRLLLLLILGLACSGTVAEAEEAKALGSASVGKLASPAAPASVEALLHAAEIGTTAQAIDTARRLAAAGGAPAARGLEQFLAHRDCRVRTAALEGLTRIGLRFDGLARHARRAVAEGSEQPRHEKLAAIRLLGAVGDGRDMPRLLEIAAPTTQDRELRSTAFRAMSALTGARLPYVQSRWAYWWKKQSKRRATLLERAIEAITDDPTAETVDLFGDVIENNAIFDLPYATAVVERWLRSGNENLILVGCHLAGALRAADLVEVLAALSRRRAADSITKAARSALARLGYVAPADPE